MSLLLDKVNDFLNELNDSVGLEVEEEAVWYVRNDCLHWNTQGILNDLYWAGGDTYSSDYILNSFKQDGLFFANISSGCGDNYTIVLKLENEVSHEELQLFVEGEND